MLVQRPCHWKGDETLLDCVTFDTDSVRKSTISCQRGGGVMQHTSASLPLPLGQGSLDLAIVYAGITNVLSPQRCFFFIYTPL